MNLRANGRNPAEAGWERNPEFLAQFSGLPRLARRFISGRVNAINDHFSNTLLVRMTELYPNSSVFTIDQDFLIYRKNTNQLISTIAPWN
ncbi:hypothetical protein ACQ4M3_16950 [Leptolyngbya sp. AN03gr2]|uniref:hypothetical protein n=1 Tax=Leptolyngbya sp. AN03gr2 TaxID=3423364 RepID=UPI003D3157FE